MYDELIAKLFSFPGRGATTFNAMKRLDEKLGFPHKNFRSIHIGGTNGKGSVAMKVARALEEEGYKVGLYTSPHISDFRERIQINGHLISREESEAILEHLFSLIEEDLSFFDLLTAMAFLYFKEKGVDWAVIEVGLGGKLDATNVMTPEIAVITSIGFDHTRILGHTLEAIAREKGGIAKPGIPLVVGPSASRFYPGAIATPPQPFYDLENQAIARAVLEKLHISEKAIERGLKVRPRCRFERRGDCLFDVAHNPDGFAKLVQALKFHFPNQKFHFAIAFTEEKDWRTCLDLIEPLASHITALRGQSIKLIPPEVIVSARDGVDIAESIETIDRQGELLVVCGSFYIMP